MNEGPWSSTVDLGSDGSDKVLQLSFLDHASGGPQVQWLNEKLVLVVVWVDALRPRHRQTGIHLPTDGLVWRIDPALSRVIPATKASEGQNRKSTFASGEDTDEAPRPFALFRDSLHRRQRGSPAMRLKRQRGEIDVAAGENDTEFWRPAIGAGRQFQAGHGA